MTFCQSGQSTSIQATSINNLQGSAKHRTRRLSVDRAPTTSALMAYACRRIYRLGNCNRPQLRTLQTTHGSRAWQRPTRMTHDDVVPSFHFWVKTLRYRVSNSKTPLGIFKLHRFITALHGMQSRYSDGNSVCPSVRPSVCQTRAL